MTAPVWVVSNGFHTSLALRAADLPLAKEVFGSGQADVVLLGWGARDIYRGYNNPWTVCEAVFGGPSLLHVIPIRGTVRSRFLHSDIVRFDLPCDRVRALARELERAFARDELGRLEPQGRGYYAESRFYRGRERFYFPKVCNTWVASKLQRSGVPLCVPASLLAPVLIRQAARAGKREERRSAPVDAF